MKKRILIAMLTTSIFCAEVEINNPDISGDNNQYPLVNKVIGDFDGDGKDDLLLLTGHQSSGSSYVDRMTIYSYSKREVLLSVAGASNYREKSDAVAFSDLDGDGTVEVFFGLKVYNYKTGVQTSGN